jgi:hypothetical protein
VTAPQPPHAEPVGRGRAVRLAVLAAVQAAILPALGVPMFFRNEAAGHFLLWQRMGFFDLFRDFLTSRSMMSNAVASRPLVRALEWIQVRVFGLASTWYIVFNGAVFVGFAVALFALAWRLSGPRGAVLAVLLLMSCFLLAFYPVLNAIHGLQYPLEMALCTASLLAFHTAFAGSRRWFAPAVLLALSAFTCHAASAIVVPLAVAAMATTAPGLSRRARITVAALSPLGVGLTFAIERGGVPGGLMDQPDLGAKIAFAIAQLRVLGEQVTKLPTGPALAWAFVYEALAGIASVRAQAAPARAAVGALVLAVPLWLVWRMAPAAGVVVTMLLIVVSAWRRPAHAFLAVWAAAGVLLFLATPESNASYARHFAVPCVLLMADIYRRMLLDPLAARLRLARRPAALEWGAAAVTAVLVAVAAAASRWPIPVVSAKVEQLRYVADLSLVFRDGLHTALERVPPHGTLVVLSDWSRADELQSLYGADYFTRLRPAKNKHYAEFVQLVGRPDVGVVLVALDSLAAAPAAPVLAVNAWEIEAIASRRPAGAGPAVVLARQRARAGVFPPP